MLFMEWSGLVWSGVCMCAAAVCLCGVVPVGGGILMTVGKRVQVAAGTAWRSVSPESGVWSLGALGLFAVEESGWFEARGDENVPAVQSHQNPPTDLQFLPTTATSVVPVVHLMPPRCTEHGRYMQCSSEKTARLDLECSDRQIAMRLPVSTCLVRPSRAFLIFYFLSCSVCFVLFSPPSPPPLGCSFPSGTNLSRQSHPRAVVSTPPTRGTQSAVQRWVGLLRHGGPLPLPGRLPSNSTREQESRRAGRPGRCGCLLPILLDRKAHAQIQYLCVWMTSVGKSLSKPLTRRARPSTTWYPFGGRDGE